MLGRIVIIHLAYSYFNSQFLSTNLNQSSAGARDSIFAALHRKKISENHLKCHFEARFSTLV